jgi:hypothetical protein
MSAVSLDVQRRLEQRWAARLLRPNEPSGAKDRPPESSIQVATPQKPKKTRAEVSLYTGRMSAEPNS